MAGGENRRGQSYLNSTEILVAGTYAWTLVSPLPQKYWYFRMVTLANTPHMFGKLVTSRPADSHVSGRRRERSSSADHLEVLPGERYMGAAGDGDDGPEDTGWNLSD